MKTLKIFLVLAPLAGILTACETVPSNLNNEQREWIIRHHEQKIINDWDNIIHDLHHQQDVNDWSNISQVLHHYERDHHTSKHVVHHH